MMDSEVYVNPWLEYMDIMSRVKKRIIKKPKLAEAVRDLNKLSRRFDQEQAKQYAGACKLAVARLEHQMRNYVGETSSLKQAGDFYYSSELQTVTMSLPSFNVNLNNALHCYQHAIRTHVQYGRRGIAVQLCLIVGEKLYLIHESQLSQAQTYFEKAHALATTDPATVSVDVNPCAAVLALQWIIRCNVEQELYDDALHNCTRLEELRQRIGGGAYDYLQGEVALTALLCIVILNYHTEGGKRFLDEYQTRLVRRFIDEPPTLDDSLENIFGLEKGLFLDVQGFLIGVERKSVKSADHCLSIFFWDLNPVLQVLTVKLLDRCY